MDSQAENAAITDVEQVADVIAQKLEQQEEVSNESEETEVTPEENREEETEENEVTEDKAESENDEVEQEAEEEPIAEEDAETYSSVNELAEATGMELDEFLNTIKVTRKVDGVEEEVTLHELREGNQRNADYTKKTMELAEQRRSFEADSQAKQQQLEDQLNSIQAMTQNIEQLYTQEFADINWKELEESDPTDYLIQRQKATEAYNRVNQIKEQANIEAGKLAQENQVKQHQMLQETLEKERALMLKQNPDWADESEAKKGQAEISSYLKDKGFSDTEISQLVDHRIINILRDAVKVKGISSKAEVAKKKVRKLPKMLKSGKQLTKADSKAEKKKSDWNTFKKSGGSMDDLGDLIASKL